MTDKKRCAETVYSGIPWSGSPCSRAAVRDGFCKQHHPDTAKAKDAAWRAKFNAKMDAEKARYAQQAKERAVLAAAKAWADADTVQSHHIDALYAAIRAAYQRKQ